MHAVRGEVGAASSKWGSRKGCSGQPLPGLSPFHTLRRQGGRLMQAGQGTSMDFPSPAGSGRADPSLHVPGGKLSA